VIRRNLVDRFPYRCPAGAVLDSGDYRAGVDHAIEAGGLAELRRRHDKARRRHDKAREEGWVYGIGYATVVEPSISNMGYITTVLSPTERRAAGPKNGAQAAAAVTLDPLGGVSVIIDSLPQGQGHRTVTAQGRRRRVRPDSGRN
jgi:2-furoyl-CoA dehydrogenase large subunit